MAKIPEKVKLTSTGPEMLNALRNDIGGEYANKVPAAIAEGQLLSSGARATSADSLASLRAIGAAVLDYAPNRNAFLSALVNRIGRVLITSRLYENPWRALKKGILEYGETTEEIFVSIAQAHQFNPEVAEEQVFRREIPDVRSAFHTMNYQKFYKQTVSIEQLRQAFLSWQGISDLVSKIIEGMYTAANYDEFIMMKYVLGRAIVSGNVASAPIQSGATADIANANVTSILGISNLFEFMSAAYNEAGVPTYSDKSSQYLILNAQYAAVIDVNVLARAFNMDKAEFMGHTIMVDSLVPNGLEMQRLGTLVEDVPAFTEEEIKILNGVPAVLVDKDWFMIYDNLIEMDDIKNPEGLYYNYTLHMWKTFSYSPFANAVAFTTQKSSITSVAVTPGAISVNKPANVTFSATVESTGIINKAVVWSIDAAAVDSQITQDGVLHIGNAETAETITVTATSVADGSKTGTATVTITA